MWNYMKFSSFWNPFPVEMDKILLWHNGKGNFFAIFLIYTPKKGSLILFKILCNDVRARKN